MSDQNEGWMKQLDERQRKEVSLALFYTHNFNHGTPGHNHYVLIAKMAEMLDLREEAGETSDDQA